MSIPSGAVPETMNSTFVGECGVGLAAAEVIEDAAAAAALDWAARALARDALAAGLGAAPEEKTSRRRDDWLREHKGWQIRRTDAWPGWWEATQDGYRRARYYDLADLMDRLDATYA